MNQSGFVQSIFALFRSLVAKGAWKFLCRLPGNVALCVAVGLGIQLVVWQFLLPKERLGTIGADWAQTALVIFYVAAGLFWGIQRTLNEAASESLRGLERDFPAVFDSLVGGMIDQSGVADAQVSLEALRQRWDEAAEELLGAKSNVGRWPILGGLASRLAKRYLDHRTASIRELVESLIQRGTTHLSPCEGKEYLRARLVKHLAETAQAQVSAIRRYTQLTASVLMALPVGLCWLINFFLA